MFAGATAGQIEADIGSESFDATSAFRTPLTDYNVLIHLNDALLPRAVSGIDYVKVILLLAHCHLTHHQPAASGKKHKFKNLEPTPEVKEDLVSFDPAALYVSELRSRFSRVALFFHDGYGGDKIGVVWKPQVVPQQESLALVDFESRPWRSTILTLALQTTANLSVGNR